MSDSLIAFQPAIDEPSNMVPSFRKSSSTIIRSKVTCCHLPRGSVKRMSTYLTSFSLISLRMSPAVVFLSAIVQSFPSTLTVKVSRPDGRNSKNVAPALAGPSDRFHPRLAGADADGFLDIEDENLAVADAARARSLLDGLDRGFQAGFGNDDLDFHFGQEVHHIF